MKEDLVAALVIVGGAVALHAFGGLAPIWGPGANRDASFWPFVMLLLLVVLGSALAIQAASRLRATPHGPTEAPRVTGRASRTLAVLAYMPALLVFGFYVSALAYTFALPPLLGGVRWRTSAAFALLFTGVLYLIFTLGLRMELPEGYVALAWARSGAG